MASACGVLGDGSKPVKVHHLIKAPENTPESVSFRESWDASKPVTVYKTPENLPDGTPCTAATVILRSKGCAWWWKSGCTFCGYFNDVRDDVSAEDMFSQWEFAKKIRINLKTAEWSRSTPRGPSSKIERTLPSGRILFCEKLPRWGYI